MLVHLGVEADFRPARKAYPAFLVEGLEVLIGNLQSAGMEVVSDEPLAGVSAGVCGGSVWESDSVDGGVAS